MIQSFGSGLGHAESTWKRGMSSAKAGMATMAATSDEKNNLTASSCAGCERLYDAAPCFARFGDLDPGDIPLGLGPRQIIGQSRTVALWHADVKLLPDAPGRGTQDATTWLINNAGPGRVESDLPMKTKTHFAFRVDVWDHTGSGIVEHCRRRCRSHAESERTTNHWYRK